MLNSSMVQPFLLQLEASSCFFSWPIFNPTSKLNSVLDPSGFKIKTLAEYWKIKFKNQFYLHNIMTYFILIIFSFLFLHEKYNIAVSLWGLRTEDWGLITEVAIPDLQYFYWLFYFIQIFFIIVPVMLLLASLCTSPLLPSNKGLCSYSESSFLTEKTCCNAA